MSTTSAGERIFMAIDTSDVERAEELANIAKGAGATTVKLGLELQTATSWRHCADLADRYGLDWVADAKLGDIPNTVGNAAANIAQTTETLASLPHPPIAITMHTSAGMEAMRAAKTAAGDTTKILGVTVLTSIDDRECYHIFGPPPEEGVPDEVLAQRAIGYRAKKVMQLARNAARAGLDGVVCSPNEVEMLMEDPETRGLYKMVPGIRPAGAAAGDQKAIATPSAAILAGADALVIGRPIYGAADPAQAFANITAEIQGALDVKA